MNAEIQRLSYSPLFSIFDFKCREEPGCVSKPEWRKSFDITFTRQGNFGYRLGGDFYDVHSGVILLENKETECTISHEHHIKDVCTSLSVEETLLSEIAQVYSESKCATEFDECSAERFRFPAPLIHSTPEIEYIHSLIYQNAVGISARKILKIDLLIIALLQQIFSCLTNASQIMLPLHLDRKTKERHLETIDRGKRYILNNFQNEMSLADIAKNTYVSPFHFSRLFKHFTSYSPYRYLLELRLSHAVLLLRNTSLSITEICFDSGFNSLEHFIATFTNHHGMSPLKFRHHPS